MIVKNIYARLLLGGSWLAFGLVILKIYFDRNKQNLWGDFYRSGEEMMKGLGTEPFLGKILLALSFISIVGGLIAIFYGFRTKGVGF
jgi:hypothetical protein